MNELYLSRIALKRQEIPNFVEYPFSIPVIQEFNEIELNSPVTFLIGENGIGKSTFMEAIAMAMGLNPEGGSQNFHFSTFDDYSQLYQYLQVSKFGVPKTKFFLRAESFYNVASSIDRDYNDGMSAKLNESYGGSLHECSHGESFLQLVENRFSDHGLYILDEPEAALSPTRQMTLLCLIDQLVKEGSQFIIATHSPILISYIHGKILDLNRGFCETKLEDTDIYKTYQDFLKNPYGMQKILFEE